MAYGVGDNAVLNPQGGLTVDDNDVVRVGRIILSSNAQAIYLPPSDNYVGIAAAAAEAAAAGGGIVQLKPMIYTLTAPLPFYANVVYQGAGCVWNMFTHFLTDGTILEGDGTFNCFEYQPTDLAVPYTGSGLKDSELHGAGVLHLGIRNFLHGIKAGALYQGGVSLLRLDDIAVVDCRQWGIWIENSDAVQIGTVTCMENDKGQFYLGSSGTTLWNYGDCQIKAIFAQAPRNDYKSKGIVFEARGSGSNLNDVGVSHIGVNGTNTLADQAATLTNGVANIGVADLSKLSVGMGVVFTTTVGGFTANRTYFVIAVSAETGAGTIQLSLKKGSTAILPNATVGATLRTWGYTLLEVCGNPYLGGTQPAITYCTFSHFDVEQNGTAGVLLQDCNGCYFRSASTVGNNGMVLRNMGRYNHVHNSVSSTAIDADDASQDTTLTGVKPLVLRHKMLSGIVYDEALFGHGIYMNGFGDSTPDIGVGDTVFPCITYGRPNKLKFSQVGGTQGLFASDGQVVTYTGAGGHTITMPTLSDANTGIRYYISNPGAGTLTLAAAGGQNFIGGGASAATRAVPTLTNAIVVGHKTGSTFFWAVS
jgi:hypothetical protein